MPAPSAHDSPIDETTDAHLADRDLPPDLRIEVLAMVDSVLRAQRVGVVSASADNSTRPWSRRVAENYCAALSLAAMP